MFQQAGLNITAIEVPGVGLVFESEAGGIVDSHGPTLHKNPPVRIGEKPRIKPFPIVGAARIRSPELRKDLGWPSGLGVGVEYTVRGSKQAEGCPNP